MTKPTRPRDAQAEVPSTARALFILARPQLLPWMLGIPLFGFAFALWDGSIPPQSLDNNWLRIPGMASLVQLLGSWTLIHIGTMWLNAALDREENAAIGVRRCPVPPSAAAAAYIALLVAFAVILGAPATIVGCTLLASLLSVAYSHPHLAWKGHPVLGPLVNAVGYGLLSPIAGWSATGAPLTGCAVITFLLWTLWMLGAYFSAQAFQEQEDRDRGYRTLVVTHGPQFTLRTARLLMESSVVLAAFCTLCNLYPRLTLLAYPWFLVPHWHFSRWLVQPNGGNPDWAMALYKKMLLGGLIIFILTGIDYLITPI